MRLKSLRTKGISAAFPHEVSIDFEALGEGLVAIVGNNGAGKTTLLELSGPGTLHRHLPSYNEGLTAHLHPAADQAHTDLTWELDGHEYRCKVQIDPHFNGNTGKTEAWLWRDGAPIAGEKVTPVDRELAALLPTLDELLAANFACQSGAGGFWVASKAEKKALFMKFLRLERLQEIADAAKARGQKITARLEALRTDIAALVVKAERLAWLAETIATARADVARLDEQLTPAREARAAAEVQLAAARDALARAEATAGEQARRKAQVAAELTTARAELAAVAVRLAELDAALVDAAAVRAAAARVAEIDAERATVTATADAARLELAPLDTEGAEVTARLAALRDEYARLQAEITAADASAGRVDAAGDLEGGAAEAAAERDQHAERLAAEEARAAALDSAAEQERTAVVARSTLLARREDLQPRSTAAQRAAAAARADQARAARDTLAAELRTAGDATPSLEAAADDERTAATTRATLLARRADLQPRTAILDQVDVEHAMCAVCPLAADARGTADTLAMIDEDLAAVPEIDGTPAADALRAHRARLADLQAAHHQAVEAVGAAEAAVAALADDPERATTLAAVEAELAALPAIEGTPAADAARAHQALLAQLRRDHLAAAARASEAATASAAMQADRTAAAALPALRTALAGNIDQGKSTKKRVTELDAARAALREQLTTLGAVLERLHTERTPLAPVAARLVAVETADGQLAPTRESHAGLTARIAHLEAEDAALLPPDLAAERAAVAAAETSSTKLAAAIVALEAALKEPTETLQRALGEQASLGDVAGKLAAARATEGQLATDAADWAHLERAFGADGVQALEIDAAGPAVTAIANELLSSCYGPRFQLRIDTTEPLKSKKGKFREVFDVAILDGEAGREGKRGSGGEMVIVETALRLALAIYNGQRSGRRVETMWLDEATGALSPENASRYVTMLRRARQIGGFHQMILVSHLESVWSQCDARIFVAGGRVSTTPIGDLALEAA